MANIARLAKRIEDATRDRKPMRRLVTGAELTLAEAYAVQAAGVGRRIARGERRVGVKMGFTSRAKMEQMGLDDMVWGRLTDGMILEDGGTLDLGHYIHPRVEPEIAFLLGRRLEGPVSPAEALAAVEAVAPAMEIIDSRYQGFKFTLEEVIADNLSACGFVLGAWAPLDADLSNLGMVLEFNGRPVQIGSSAAVLGHPARALAAAARLSSAAGEPLDEGWIVMSGGATAAEFLKPATYVRNSVEALGSVALKITG